MNRTWKLLCLPALLAVALTASSVRAQGTDSKRDDDLREILKAIRLMQDDVGRLRADLIRQQEDNDRRLRLNDQRDEMFEKRLRILENKLDEIDKTRDRVSRYLPDQPVLPGDVLRDIDARIKRLEQQQQERRSNTITPNETINQGPPEPARGSVRLVNLSFGTGLVSVNGATYTLQPGEVRVVSVAAGTFTYEVLRDSYGFGFPQQTRFLAPNGGITLTMRP